MIHRAKMQTRRKTKGMKVRQPTKANKTGKKVRYKTILQSIQNKRIAHSVYPNATATNINTAMSPKDKKKAVVDENPLININFAAPTNMLITKFKILKGNNATVPEGRIDLISSIINFYKTDDVKTLWKCTSKDKWPASKSNAVRELAHILMDGNCARNKTTNKSECD